MSWDRRISPIDHPARWGAYHPDEVCLEGLDASVSWAELDRRAWRTAAWLIEDQGLQRGDRVALLAHNHPWFFELAFACWRAGLVLAPLNWRLAPPELDALLDLCRPAVLLVGAHCSAAAQQLGWEGPQVEVVDWQAGAARRGRPERTLRAAGLDDPALILFTSGTTGRPKGALLPVRQLLYNGVNTLVAFGLTRADTTLIYTPLFHTGAINVLAMPLLQAGGRVVVHRSFDAAAILASPTRAGVTAIFGVPTTFQMLSDHPDFESADLSGLRLCLCGGAPLPASLVRRYQERGLTLTQGFGMTEVGPNCFYLPAHEALARAGAVGKPMPTCQARVVDADGEPCAPDEVGALWLSGPHVCLGYFRDPDATTAALEDGWFRTGDLARMDQDGFFHIAGRDKDMYISGGENVYPAEVEVALAGHPAVAECAVVPMPDSRWGESGCAFVVPAGPVEAASTRDPRGPHPAGLDAVELRGYLRAHLAGYKVPKAFVPVEALPRNASGKVLRTSLRDQACSHGR